VGSGDQAEFLRVVDADEAAEVRDVELVGPASFFVGNIGEPFELGRDLGQSLELGGGQRSRCRDETCRYVDGRHESPLQF
jgi:hypothetical protein